LISFRDILKPKVESDNTKFRVGLGVPIYDKLLEFMSVVVSYTDQGGIILVYEIPPDVATE